jgi:unsaturated chondroitin disaccharide hydrolase
MKNKSLTITLLALFILSACAQKKSTDKEEALVKQLTAQLSFALDEIEPLLENDTELVAPRTIEDGEIRMVPSRDWTSGFFAGEMWLMYQITKDTMWRNKAMKFTALLEQEKFNGTTHDMGFKMFCSFGRGYEITKNPHYRDILLQSAETLIIRFNPEAGCIRSWDHNSDKWDFPVIIDNMMNLELLFWAAKETCDSTYKEIAVSHAVKTLENHFREDFSTFHVVDYDPETGEVNERTTHQGYSSESSWARGQAWGLYGFTMVFRETNDPVFLKQAENIANYILDHPRLPEDFVPYWDFDAPEIPDEPRDASAASVMASALYELAEYSSNREKYLSAANKMFESLSSDKYLARPGTNKGFILKHSTGSRPHDSEVDVPLIYADYYYLESFIRKYHSCYQ